MYYPNITPYTVPDLLERQDQLETLTMTMRTQVGDLAAGGFPDEVLDPIYLACAQAEHALRNLRKGVKKAVALEKAQQTERHLASPNIALPKYSYRVDVNGQTVEEDVTKEQATHVQVISEMDDHDVNMYQRPVTSTSPDDWEKIY